MKQIFHPKYQWIRTSDICPEPNQKVLIVRDLGDTGMTIDRLVVETAFVDPDKPIFVNQNGESIKPHDVLFWSLFPVSLERKVYKRKE